MWGMLPTWGVVPDHVARINAGRLRSQGLFLSELRQMLRDLPQARHAHTMRTPRTHHAHTMRHAHPMRTPCAHPAHTRRGAYGWAVGVGWR